MISIKKYLQLRIPEAESTLRQVIHLLLKGLETGAVEGDQVDSEQFRAGIRELRMQLGSDASPADYLVAAGAATTGLRDYQERTRRFIRAQSVELHHMVAMLSQTVANISTSSDRSVRRLQEVEKLIERASVIEDIRTLKVRLGECLSAIQQEVEGHKQDSSATVSSLQRELAQATERMKAPITGAATDPVTGLRGWQAAEEAMAVALDSGRNFFVAAVVVHRVQAVNQRFGHAAGDHLLRVVHEHLHVGLSPKDRLFRWQGPSFLALLERSGPDDAVRAEIGRLTLKTEDLLDIGTRSVFLPISASSLVCALSAPIRPLITKLTQFVSAHGPVE